jgi:RNA polymerase sigma factor (sigma-70 family)
MKAFRLSRHSLVLYNKSYAVMKNVHISIAHNFRNKGSRHRVSRKIAKALLKNPSDDDPPFIETHKNAEFTYNKSKFGIFAFIASNQLVHCRSPPLSFIFRFYQIKKMEDNIMDNINWNDFLKDEDRKINNSDRKYRYHHKSFDAMGEKTVAMKSFGIYIGIEDILLESSNLDCIKNPKLRKAVKKLTKKQQIIVWIMFFKKYNQQEAAQLISCDQSSVSRLLSKALMRLKELLSE